MMELPIGNDLTAESYRRVQAILRDKPEYRSDPAVRNWVLRPDVRAVHDEVAAIQRAAWMAEHGDTVVDTIQCTHCGSTIELIPNTVEDTIREHGLPLTFKK